MKGCETCPPRASGSHIVWSALASFVGIALIGLLSRWTVNDVFASLYLIAAFGSSSALIYTAPNSDFSQPRNLLGGHLIAGFVGISLYHFLPLDLLWQSALGVSISIVLMQLTRTLHPPAGATALLVVVGSEEVHQAGYWFLISPILTGTLILLLVALVVNNLSGNPQRHYPRYWW
jgi:CBS domain-containing membrane protein